MIARFQSREAVLGPRRDQIVADGFLVPQKFIAELDTNRVFTEVVRSGVAFAVAIKTREGIRTAGLQSRTENVLDHKPLG